MLLMGSMGNAGNPNPSYEPRTMSLKTVLKMPKTKRVKLYLSAKTLSMNTLSSSVYKFNLPWFPSTESDSATH
jgi:hypothetical protein